MNAIENLGGPKMARAQIIRVKIEEGRTGLFYATSPDLRGLLVAEPDMASLYDAIPQAISDLFEVQGTKVIVAAAERDGEALRPWIAMPAEVAQLALAG